MGLFKHKKQKTTHQKRQPQSRVLENGRTLATNKYYRPKNSTVTAQQNRVSTIPAGSKINLSKVVNIVIGLCLFMALFFASTLAQQPFIRITDTSVNYREHKAYTIFTEKYLSDSPLSRSKVLFQSTAYEQAMKQAFPEIDQISAVVPLGGRKLSVTMSLSEPLATVLSGSERAIATSDGTLVTANSDNVLLDSDNLPSLRFTAPLEIFENGSPILTNSEVLLLQLVRNELQTKSRSLPGVDSLSLKEYLFNIADGQLEVRFSETPTVVKFSVYADASTQVGTMLKAFEQLNREGQESVSYIDVRVPGKVYVK